MKPKREYIELDFDLNRLERDELLFTVQQIVDLYSLCLQGRHHIAAEFTHALLGLCLARGLREQDSRAVRWFQRMMEPRDGHTIN